MKHRWLRGGLGPHCGWRGMEQLVEDEPASLPWARAPAQGGGREGEVCVVGGSGVPVSAGFQAHAVWL